MTTPSGHLGDRAAGLVDGALPHTDRDRAVAHLLDCAACRAEVDEQRRLKAALTALPGPDLPTGFAGRLLDIARPPASAHGADGTTGATGADGANGASGANGGATGVGRGDDPDVPGWIPWEPRMAGFGVGPAAAGRGSRLLRRARWLAAAAVAAAAVGAVTAATVPRAGPPVVAPPVATFTVDHTVTSGGLPGADPAMDAVAAVSTGR